MADDLSEYPEQLRGKPDTMPWDPEYSAAVWIDGTLLTSFSSSTLLAHRRLLVKKNGRLGHYWDAMIEAIDTILTERGGE